MPALSKWIEVTNSDPTGPIPLLSQATLEVLHVPWELRGRLHAETAYMPSQGVRNRYGAVYLTRACLTCVYDTFVLQYGRRWMVPGLWGLQRKLHVAKCVLF